MTWCWLGTACQRQLTVLAPLNVVNAFTMDLNLLVDLHLWYAIIPSGSGNKLQRLGLRLSHAV